MKFEIKYEHTKELDNEKFRRLKGAKKEQIDNR
jgi:hypothetical protein